MDEEKNKEKMILEGVGKIETLRGLPKLSEEDKLPTERTCMVASLIFSEGVRYDIFPSRIDADLFEGGVILEYYGADKRYFLFECFNTNEIIFLYSTGEGNPQVREVTLGQLIEEEIWKFSKSFVEGGTSTSPELWEKYITIDWDKLLEGWTDRTKPFSPFGDVDGYEDEEAYPEEDWDPLSDLEAFVKEMETGEFSEETIQRIESLREYDLATREERLSRPFNPNWIEDLAKHIVDEG